MLDDKVRQLLSFMCGGIDQPPVPSSLLIAEEARGDLGVFGRLLLPRSALKTPEEYAPRFEELMAADYAWLNMHYCGIFEGHGLILVDYPRQASPRRGTERVPTSVNYSGPMKLVRDAGWDATAYVTVSPDFSQ